ncbi:MAG: hypothetical protein COA74_03000 [Gammaproteobacteria bacterium]|nr:MAG: hypothetical protein COA74_03000 [Gammaproteobacteria bacterium]
MKKTKIALALLLATATSSQLLATNGYFSHGVSAKDKGRAGAAAAIGTDAFASANNPANLLQVGERLEAGISFFSPIRSYKITGEPSLSAGFTPVIGGFPGCAQPGVAPCQIPFSTNVQEIDSDKEFFPIPSFAWATQLSSTSAFGVAVYGNGGMNTEYNGGSARVFDPNTNAIVDAPGTFGAGKTGIDLIQLFINTTYAFEASDQLDLGVSVIAVMQAFEATGLAAFANISEDAENLTNNGHDVSYGVGIKVGATFSVTDEFSIGLSYQSEIDMTEFDDYAGLFAEKGNFDIPATYIIGFAWKTSATSTLMVDFQKIMYSDIPAIANTISPITSGQCFDALNSTLFAGGTPTPASGAGCLGGSAGAGFGWNDVSVIKIGYEWKLGKDTMRLGYSTNDQPIDSSEVNFNLLAPGVVEDHFTVGYTLVQDENEWDFFFMYAPEVKVSGTSQFDPAQTIEFKMHQFEAGFSYKF